MKSRCFKSIGGRSVRAVIEGLEMRRMLSASIDHHGRLIIDGTGHADSISVAIDAQDSSKLLVSVDGKSSVFNLAAVQSLKINSHGGDDSLAIDPTITIATQVTGEKKADSADDPGPAGKKNEGKTPPVHGANQSVSGTILHVDADTNHLTIAIANGAGHVTQVTFTVTSATTITADGHSVSLGSLNVATPVVIQTSSSNPTIASGIAAVNRHVTGIVTSVDAGNRIVTLRQASGISTIYSVNANATVTINGTPSPLSAIAANMHIDVTISVFDNSDTIAITATAGKPHGKAKKPKVEHLRERVGVA